jgi:hypothetical protein
MARMAPPAPRTILSTSSSATSVKHTVAAFTGSTALGDAAGAAAGMVPDRAKSGAAAGALLAGGIVGKGLTIGTAGAAAFTMPIFLPAIAIGAVTVGALCWLFGDD